MFSGFRCGQWLSAVFGARTILLLFGSSELDSSSDVPAEVRWVLCRTLSGRERAGVLSVHSQGSAGVGRRLDSLSGGQTTAGGQTDASRSTAPFYPHSHAWWTSLRLGGDVARWEGGAWITCRCTGGTSAWPAGVWEVREPGESSERQHSRHRQLLQLQVRTQKQESVQNRSQCEGESCRLCSERQTSETHRRVGDGGLPVVSMATCRKQKEQQRFQRCWAPNHRCDFFTESAAGHAAVPGLTQRDALWGDRKSSWCIVHFREPQPNHVSYTE